MVEYFFCFLWGIVVLVCLVGWGGVINRIVFPKHRVDWGQKGAWGVALSIFVGGMLNVTWTVSRTVILAYLGAGFLFWVIGIFKTKQHN